MLATAGTESPTSVGGGALAETWGEAAEESVPRNSNAESRSEVECVPLSVKSEQVTAVACSEVPWPTTET